MPIHVECPGCGATFQAPGKLAGQVKKKEQPSNTHLIDGLSVGAGAVVLVLRVEEFPAGQAG